VNSISGQIFMQHMQNQMHIEPPHWKEHAQQIAPFIVKVAQPMESMQAQQQAVAAEGCGGSPMPIGNGNLLIMKRLTPRQWLLVQRRRRGFSLETRLRAAKLAGWLLTYKGYLIPVR